MTPIRLDLPVNPIPQGRPRIVFGKRGVHAYKPPAMTDFYSSFQFAVHAAGIRQPLTGDLEVTWRFWRHCRSSSNRGDLSNLLKACEDAGNGYLWEDDRQIRSTTAIFESWGPKTPGRIIVEIRPAEPLAKEVTVTT